MGYALLPIGPYRLASRVSLARDDYRLSDLVLRMGSSELRGGGSFDTRGERPRLEVELASEVIQVDDFEVPDGTAAPDGSGAPEAPTPFLSPEGLLRLDGRLAVRADRVLSGEDVAGRGELVTGRFTDFGRRVPPEELLAMLVRFGTGVVTTPLSRIFRGPLPTDGEAICRAAWQQGERAAAASPSP